MARFSALRHPRERLSNPRRKKIVAYRFSRNRRPRTRSNRHRNPKKTTPAKHKPAVKVAAKKSVPAHEGKASKPAPSEAAEDSRQITPLLKPTAIPCKPGSFAMRRCTPC